MKYHILQIPYGITSKQWHQILLVFKYLPKNKPENSWDTKSLVYFKAKIETVWNQSITREEIKANEATQRDDAREDERLEEIDFNKYMDSTVRRQAASLYSRDNKTVNECLIFRNFIMTKVAICNTNRPGILEFINVSHITGK